MNNKSKAGDPAASNTNQPSGCKRCCCCLHTGLGPLRALGKKTARNQKERQRRRGYPTSPSDSACYFPRLQSALLVGRGWQRGTRRRKSSGPRSDSATLNGVCLCPGDRSASARVWGTLSDDLVCVIYELWKGCISSTHGRPHGKWRNSEFINIRWMMINVLV